MTTVRRSNKFNPVQTFTEFVGLKTDAERLSKRADALKGRIKEWFPTASEAEVYSNENGSLFYDLPETVTVAGVDYKGIENRKSVRVLFNEEVAEKILKRRGVYEKALSYTLDQEKIALLVQTGEITEADLDKMFQEADPTWSLYPVKGEVL